jgi:hypothetical protein
VCHHQDGLAALRLRPEQFQDLHPGAEVQFPGGFVGQQDRVTGTQGPGDGHPLLFTAGQLMGEMVRPGRQPHLAKHLPGHLGRT